MKRLAFFAAVLGVVAVVLPSAAAANVVVAPGLTFPEREVGSTSDPQTVTVTIVCNGYNPMLNPQCTTLDTFVRNPQFLGDNPGDFFAEGGNCPPQLTLTSAPAVQCSILVRFKPTAAGTRKAVFLAGTSASGGPNTIAVQGSAVPKPVQPAKKCKKGQKKKKCKKKKKK